MMAEESTQKESWRRGRLSGTSTYSTPTPWFSRLHDGCNVQIEHGQASWSVVTSDRISSPWLTNVLRRATS